MLVVNTRALANPAFRPALATLEAAPGAALPPAGSELPVVEGDRPLETCKSHFLGRAWSPQPEPLVGVGSGGTGNGPSPTLLPGGNVTSWQGLPKVVFPITLASSPLTQDPPSGPGLNTLACLVAGTPVLAQAGGPSALATPATPTTVFPAAPVPHGQPHQLSSISIQTLKKGRNQLGRDGGTGWGPFA